MKTYDELTGRQKIFIEQLYPILENLFFAQNSKEGKEYSENDRILPEGFPISRFHEWNSVGEALLQIFDLVYPEPEILR